MSKRAELLKAILDDRNKQAHIGALADAFVDKFGGVAGIMKELKIIYDTAAAPVQAKIILSGIDLVREANPKSKGQDMVQSLPPDELAAAVEGLFGDDE
jgi:hypothetical protein